MNICKNSLLFVLMLLSTNLVAQDITRDDELVVEAASYIDMGNYKEAIRLLSQSIKANNKNFYAWYNRAVLNMQRGQYKDAIGDYNQALKIRPKSIECLNNRAVCKSNIGENIAAINDFNAALQLDESNAKVLFNQGLNRYQQRDFVTSNNDYQKALLINDQDEALCTNAAINLFALKKYDAALVILKKGSKLNPKNGLINYWIGKVFIELKDINNACKEFTLSKKNEFQLADAMLQQYCGK